MVPRDREAPRRAGRPKGSGLKRLILFFLLFNTSIGSADEMRMTLGERREVLIRPFAGVTVLKQNFSLSRAVDGFETGDEIASGIDAGIKLQSSSNRARTFFVGLELRQKILVPLVFETGVGLNTEYRLTPRWTLGAEWFFGDLVISKSRDRQFNGTTFAVSITRELAHYRIFLEASAGRFDEGPGFIYLSRPAGPEKLNQSSVTVGFEFSLRADNLVADESDDARVRPTLDSYPYSGRP